MMHLVVATFAAAHFSVIEGGDGNVTEIESGNSEKRMSNESEDKHSSKVMEENIIREKKGDRRECRGDVFGWKYMSPLRCPHHRSPFVFSLCFVYCALNQPQNGQFLSRSQLRFVGFRLTENGHDAL